MASHVLQSLYHLGMAHEGQKEQIRHVFSFEGFIGTKFLTAF